MTLFASLGLLSSLRVANWVVLGHSTNVTSLTRGENIFNNKIYIGDLASTYDVRCPAAKYRGEYQEVPATLVVRYTAMSNYGIRFVVRFVLIL